MDGLNSLNKSGNMLNTISSINNSGGNITSKEATREEKVKQDFMALFYKEILKQIVKTPNLSMDEDEDSGISNPVATYYNDLMVEQIAKDWVQKGYLPIDMLERNK
ncbi:MAG: hypothetical protein WCV91_03705 [Candidatus Margulisiibacteriota bacterium]